MNRAVGIEGCIETHAGAYTDSLHLPLCVDGRSHRVPTKQGHWAINLGIKPTLVDPMGQAIGENGCGGCFQIGVGTVKQLMPKTVLVLKGCQSLGMAVKKAFGITFSSNPADNRKIFHSVKTLADYIDGQRPPSP